MTVLLQVAVSRYDHINSNAQADQMLIDRLGCMPAVRAIRHNNQDVDVALGPHLTAGRRAEEDNLPWASDLDNALYEVVEDVRVRVHA
jgi:hypothetical protein